MLLADVFESFRDKCIEIYDLDPANILTAAGLVWQPCLKDKNMASSYLEFFEANNLNEWVMYQKLAVNGFKWLEEENYQNVMRDS